MGMKGNSGYFSGTSGSMKYKPDIQHFASKKLFSSTGHVSERSVSQNREFFYGKTVRQIDFELHRFGYKTTIRKSKHSTSKAKVIVVGNPDKHRNITQVQVSPGSKRHGNVPYVKISVNNPVGPKKYAKIKVIDAKKSDYKSDGNEKAYLYFRRKK